MMIVNSLSADDVGVGARGVLARGGHDVCKDKKLLLYNYRVLYGRETTLSSPTNVG